MHTTFASDHVDTSASLPHLLCVWVYPRGQLVGILLTCGPPLAALIAAPLHPVVITAFIPTAAASLILIRQVTIVLALTLEYCKSVVGVPGNQLKSFSLFSDGPHTI